MKLYSNIKILVAIIVLKSITAITINWLLQFLGLESILVYGDFSYYNQCGQVIGNWLYSLAICSLNIESFLSAKAISIAIIINSVSIYLFYMGGRRYLKKPLSKIFLLLLIFHPYLLVQTLRLSTDLFAMLFFALAFFYIVTDKKFDFTFFIASILLTGFRNMLYPTLLAINIKKWFESRQAKEKFIIALGIIGSLSYGVVSIQYAEFFLDQRNGFSIIHALENTFYLLSVREEIGVIGMDNFLINFTNWKLLQLIIFSLLFIIHVIGIIGLLMFSFKKPYIILVLTLIYPLSSIITLSHLRYLYPVIPILLFGLTIFIQNIIWKK